MKSVNITTNNDIEFKDILNRTIESVQADADYLVIEQCDQITNFYLIINKIVHFVSDGEYVGSYSDIEQMSENRFHPDNFVSDQYNLDSFPQPTSYNVVIIEL